MKNAIKLFNVAELARRCGCSQTHLRQVFLGESLASSALAARALAVIDENAVAVRATLAAFIVR